MVDLSMSLRIRVTFFFSDGRSESCNIGSYLAQFWFRALIMMDDFAPIDVKIGVKVE